MTPATVDQALAEVHKLDIPRSIVVSFATKYPEIRSHKFLRVSPSVEDVATL